MPEHTLIQVKTVSQDRAEQFPILAPNTIEITWNCTTVEYKNKVQPLFVLQPILSL